MADRMNITVPVKRGEIRTYWVKVGVMFAKKDAEGKPDPAKGWDIRLETLPISKDWDGFRLKLTVLPVTIVKEEKDALQFAFNYHSDVSNTSALREKLLRWQNTRDHTSDVIHMIDPTA